MTGVVESIRLHRLTLTTLRESRTALINTLRSDLVTAPAAIRDELEQLTEVTLLARWPGCGPTPCPRLPQHDPDTQLPLIARAVICAGTA